MEPVVMDFNATVRRSRTIAFPPEYDDEFFEGCKVRAIIIKLSGPTAPKLQEKAAQMTQKPQKTQLIVTDSSVIEVPPAEAIDDAPVLDFE